MEKIAKLEVKVMTNKSAAHALKTIADLEKIILGGQYAKKQ